MLLLFSKANGFSDAIIILKSQWLPKSNSFSLQNINFQTDYSPLSHADANWHLPTAEYSYQVFLERYHCAHKRSRIIFIKTAMSLVWRP